MTEGSETASFGEPNPYAGSGPNGGSLLIKFNRVSRSDLSPSLPRCLPRSSPPGISRSTSQPPEVASHLSMTGWSAELRIAGSLMVPPGLMLAISRRHYWVDSIARRPLLQDQSLTRRQCHRVEEWRLHRRDFLRAHPYDRQGIRRWHEETEPGGNLIVTEDWGGKLDSAVVKNIIKTIFRP